MNIKIYYQNKIVYLTNDLEEVFIEKNKQFSVYQIEEIDAYTLFEVVNQEDNNIVILLNDDIATLQKEYFSNFDVIQAAGGVVENEANEILLIHRRGFWDLPKGKLDEGESIEACALREIEEETGVNKLTMQKHLCNTFHTYVEKGKMILKETYWYYIKTTYNQVLQPQAEEQIDKAEWVKNGLQEYLKETYDSIRDVIMVYQKRKSIKKRSCSFWEQLLHKNFVGII